MIDNVVLIVTGTLHERDVQELLEKCHPLGMFDSIATLAVAQNMRELYRLVLVGSALSPWNSNYCGFQEEPLWTFSHMDLSTDIIFVSEFESNDGEIFGCRRKGTFINNQSSFMNLCILPSASTSYVEGVSQEEVTQMKTKIEDLSLELQRKNAEQEMMKQKMEQWEKMFQKMMILHNLKALEEDDIDEDQMDNDN